MTINKTDSFNLFCCFFFLGFFSSLPIRQVKFSLQKVVKPQEFNYFVLSFQWPPTLCPDLVECCTSKDCFRRKKLLYFTIHGLWPNSNIGNNPSFCFGEPFTISKIKNSVGDLKIYWPSLTCSQISKIETFWAHEWDKHGTCAAPTINGVSNYFTKVLDLYKNHNITNLLKTNGIWVSDKKMYGLNDVKSIIENKFGAVPNLICKQNNLKEIHICFTKNFKPQDCAKLKQNKCLGKFKVPPYRRGNV